jgi:hypothetical protein
MSIVTPVEIEVLVTGEFKNISPPSSPDWASIFRVTPS